MKDETKFLIFKTILVVITVPIGLFLIFVALGFAAATFLACLAFPGFGSKEWPGFEFLHFVPLPALIGLIGMLLLAYWSGRRNEAKEARKSRDDENARR